MLISRFCHNFNRLESIYVCVTLFGSLVWTRPPPTLRNLSSSSYSSPINCTQRQHDQGLTASKTILHAAWWVSFPDLVKMPIEDDVTCSKLCQHWCLSAVEVFGESAVMRKAAMDRWTWSFGNVWNGSTMMLFPFQWVANLFLMT